HSVLYVPRNALRVALRVERIHEDTADVANVLLRVTERVPAVLRRDQVHQSVLVAEIATARKARWIEPYAILPGRNRIRRRSHHQRTGVARCLSQVASPEGP